LGNKKNFGGFSPNVPIDINGNISWLPNPTLAGRLNDLEDVNITSLIEGDTLYYDATASKWQNTSVLSVQDYNNPADTNFNVAITQDLSDPTTSFMTVTAVATGTITIGAVLSGTGVTAGTTVLSAIGTANGGTGQYIVSNSQTVSSTTITSTGLSITASITPYNPATAGSALVLNTTQQGSKPIAPGFGSFMAFNADTNRTGVDRNQQIGNISVRLEPTVNNENAELNVNLTYDGLGPIGGLSPYKPQFQVDGNGEMSAAGALLLNQFQATPTTSITARSGTRVSVRTASGNGTTATLTFTAITPAPFTVGQSITVTDLVPIAYNGTYTVTASTTTSVSYLSTATGTLTKRGIINGELNDDGTLTWNGANWTSSAPIVANSTYDTGYFNEALQVNGSIIIEGSSGGGVKLAISDSHPVSTQTYLLPTAYPAVNNYVLHSTTTGELSWAADDNTTYAISAETATGGANLRLTGTNPTTTDNVKIASGTNINVVRTDADTITINSTGGDVVGPAGVADNTLAVFNGVTGKLIKASSIWNTGSNLSQIDNISCNSIEVNSLSYRGASTTTKSSASGQFILLSTTAGASNRPAMKVIVNMRDTFTNDVHMCEISVIMVTITTALISVSNQLYNSFPLATFTADVNPVGNGILRLNATATSSNNTIFTISYDILD
jgi:hypothetical protein